MVKNTGRMPEKRFAAIFRAGGVFCQPAITEVNSDRAATA